MQHDSAKLSLPFAAVVFALWICVAFVTANAEHITLVTRDVSLEKFPPASTPLPIDLLSARTTNAFFIRHSMTVRRRW